MAQSNLPSAHRAKERLEAEYERLVRSGDHAPKLSTRLASKKQAKYVRELIDGAFATG